MDLAAIMPSRQVRLSQGTLALVATALVFGGLRVGYETMQTPVVLVVDGQERRVRTHRDTVYGLLLDLGIALEDDAVVLCNGADVSDALDAALGAGARVAVERPRAVRVTADGQTVEISTFARSLDTILQEVRASVGSHDSVTIEGDLAADVYSAEAPHITVRRAIPLIVVEDGEMATVHTTADTVGEALAIEGIPVYLADGVTPGLGEPISEGLVVNIDRSTPVSVQSDGRVVRTRTHRPTVDEVLSEMGLVLTGQDYTTPTVDSAVHADMAIRVVRVSDRFLVEDEPIPFEVLWQPDPDLEIDNHRLLQEGSPGVLQRRVRVHCEDGRPMEREVEAEYVAVAPQNKIQGFGTKVVLRTLDTPEGPIEYWRVFRMLATSYSASTAGVSPTNPYYGRTRIGLPAGYGIVAVDPSWIPLGTDVYVPGYGTALAGDTGGKIKGKRIDLGYSDEGLRLWYSWVNVYLLTPVPSNIDYSLNIF